MIKVSETDLSLARNLLILLGCLVLFHIIVILQLVSKI